MAWRNEIHPPENVRNTMDELFQADIITRKQKEQMFSTEEVLLASDPLLEMNLRHQKARERSMLCGKKTITQNEIVVAAKRLISREELMEKEIRYRNKAYDRELRQFKMDLAKSSHQLVFDNNPRYVIEKSRKIEKRPKSCSYTDVRLTDVGKFELKLDKIQKNETDFKSNHMHTCNNNENDKVKTEVDIVIESSENKNMEEIELFSDRLPPVVFDTSLLIKRGKIKMTTIALPSPERENTLDVLKLCWREWRNITISNKIHKKIEGENIERLSKIENFVSTLTSESGKVNKIKKRDTKFKCPYLPQPKIKPKSIPNKNTLEKISNNQSDQTTLEKIVMQQKSKLREQEKLINKLKLEQIKLATERSAQQAQIYLESSLQEVSLPVQRKLNYLKSTFPSILDRHYNKPKPNFLVQMEARQRERQKRKEELREKTKLRILEQQKLRNEKERLKREQLEEEKRIEHELKVQQLQEQARVRALEQLALKFCHLRRLKLGFEVFKKLLYLREIQFEIAEDHYDTVIVQKLFGAWRQANQSALEIRLNFARDHYRANLMKKSWSVWRHLGMEVKRDRQVADDFQQLILETRVFRTWRGFTQVRFQAFCQELDQARLFYEGRVLSRCLTAWRRLREASDVERRAERKKEALRNSVRLVLPDFNPSRALTLFPSSKESSFSQTNNFCMTPSFI